jgi:hypothetical protein
LGDGVLTEPPMNADNADKIKDQTQKANTISRIDTIFLSSALIL